MTKETSKPSHLSEEFVHESNDEDDEALSERGGHGNKAKASEDAENAGEDHDSDSQNPGSESDNSHESSAAESDQSSLSSKKRSRGSSTTNSTAAPAAKRSKKSNFRVPAQPFNPPPGFDPLRTTVPERELRAFANLEGKQVWHITAPASVDLTQVTELDISAALRGEPILTTNGLSYGMQPAADQAEVLLLPSENSVVYKHKAQVARAFRLRQVASATGSSGAGEKSLASSSASRSATTDGTQFTAQTLAKKKEPRKQPERLGYRFMPLGVEKPVSKNDEGLRLAESIIRRATSQRSGGVAMDVDAGQASTSPEKRKEKKKKKSKAVDGVAA